MGVDKVILRNLVPREGGDGTAVVFIHGLRGDPIETWRRSEADRTLPELLGQLKEMETTEFYSFGYRTGFKPGQYDFGDIAELLYSSIMADLPNRDLIFVVHSMGGLVARQYIVDRFKNEQFDDYDRIKGVIFLSVPFEGSKWANWFPRLLANRQLRSLRKASSQLVELESSWSHYVHHKGSETGGSAAADRDIPLIAMYGKRDRVVAETSATPLYLGAEVIAVDEGHSSICKVTPSDTVFKLIASRLQKFILAAQPSAMVMHIHGSDRQVYDRQPHVVIDWTRHFDVQTKPRRLPSPDDWIAMRKELREASELWSREWSGRGRRLALYAKLCLPGGVLTGSLFSRAREVEIEVDHYGERWTTERIDRHFEVVPQRMAGNASDSGRAVIVLSVTRDIMNDVCEHLETGQVRYRTIVHMVPPGGAGPRCIRNAEQAVAFAAAVKKAADGLMVQGIKEIDLYLNCPLSLAVFVGHYLTAVCPVQVYDFANPGYTAACLV